MDVEELGGGLGWCCWYYRLLAGKEKDRIGQDWTGRTFGFVFGTILYRSVRWPSKFTSAILGREEGGMQRVAKGSKGYFANYGISEIARGP